jgi:hypothetical protein
VWLSGNNACIPACWRNIIHSSSSLFQFWSLSTDKLYVIPKLARIRTPLRPFPHLSGGCGDTSNIRRSANLGRYELEKPIHQSSIKLPFSILMVYILGRKASSVRPSLFMMVLFERSDVCVHSGSLFARAISRSSCPSRKGLLL